ncbi:YfjI family protein [Bacteroides thetaiotaomicron]|nr:YfjI family protein [Bacteroides thetaiotaomicron]
METGLYNRFLINTFRLPAAWQDVFAEEKVQADDLFNELSMRFAQMALFLKDSPTEVKLTDTQKKEFNRVFTQLLKDTDQLGNDDLLGVVKRYGVITARICCIFSAIDKGTMRMETPEVYCSDAHFKAALAIVLCCFEHSKLVSTSVKSSAEDTKPLQSPDNLSRLLTKLKKSFSARRSMCFGRGIEPLKKHRLLLIE